MAVRVDSGGEPGSEAAPERVRKTSPSQIAEWVRRCQAGDQSAWRPLYDDQFPRVYRLVRRMGVIDRDAADVCQEVFVRAFRSIGRFRGDAQFGTWLFRITVNEVRRIQRSGALRRALVTTLGREPEALAPQPDQTVQSSESLAQLQRILAEMKEKKRTVFVLHELEELATSEIAVVLGISVDTVKSRLRLARADFEKLRRRHQLIALPGGKR